LVVFGQEPLEVITFAGRKSLVPGEVTNHHLLQE
jgi:hypothetical protein